MNGVKGVAVQAKSSEDFFTIAIAGGVGFYAGIAGGITVETIASDTTAYIGENAKVNLATGAGSAQDVYVAAVNTAKVEATGGAMRLCTDAVEITLWTSISLTNRFHPYDQSG